MREGNGSRQQGMGIDTGDGVEHGYGLERNSGTAGGRLRQWHTKEWRHGDGSEHDSETQDRVVVDGRAALRPRDMATERLGRRRDGDRVVIPLLHWPL